MTNNDDFKSKDMPKNSGQRGEPFLQWRRDAKVHLRAEFMYDDTDSLWLAAQGEDTLGDAQGAPGLPAQPAQQTKVRRQYARRQAALLKQLYNAQDDKRLKNAIGDIVGGVVNGQGEGRRAWLLVEAECAEAMTDLIMRSIQAKINTANMRSAVGFSESTVTDFNRYQNADIARLPAADQPDENQRVLKLLECIKAECPNPALALEATKELNASAPNRRFVHAPIGGAAPGTMRDVQATVTYFDSMWRTLVQDGSIRKAPAGSRGDASTALIVNSEILSVNQCHDARDDEDGEALACDDGEDDRDDDDHAALAVGGRRPFRRPGFGTSANTPQSMEVICDGRKGGCFGSGHTVDKCPSAKKDRDINTHLETITRIRDGRGSGANAVPQRELPSTPRPRPASPGSVRGRRSPYGSKTLSNTPRRVSFANGSPAYAVGDAQDAEDDGEYGVLMLGESSAPTTPAGSDVNGMASATRGSKQKRNSVEKVIATADPKPKAIKLVFFTFDVYGNCSLYTFQRVDCGIAGVDFPGAQQNS